ncbi:MAG: aryl-sulfate sulfotransferase [Candidatus Hodarchaeota archaeon]
MQKSTKILLIAGILIITVVLAVFILAIVSNIMQLGQEQKPFSLDDAPAHIVEIKKDLKEKLEDETFSWDDMANFVILCQYLADNSPDILEMIKGWEQIVLFNITDSVNNMWFLIGNNSAIIEIGTNSPQNYGVLIELSFKTIVDIMRQSETSLSAFQKGDLRYEGPFNDVLKVAQITGIASATLMDTDIPTATEADFQITVDQRDFYIEGGLTIFPLIEVTIKPDYIGQHHMASPGLGSVVIVDHNGVIVTRLENSAHTVHRFINSTTIMMGGQEGYMELWNYKNNSVETLTVPGGHHDIDYNPATDTFMVLEYVYSNEIWNGTNVNVIYDLISEYNRAGDLVWQWDPRIYFPFNATRHISLGLNETFRGGIDWMHSNSFVWDKSNDVIYLMVRNLDTILKINYITKEVIWDAGRGGDFTLFDQTGIEVDTIFCHPHSMERIGSNRFILFDNDLYNQSNPSTMTLTNSSGHSRYLEFEIDEDNRIMREVWSWLPPNQSYYLPESAGDADRLPNGNTIGTFGDKGLVLNMRDPVIITEVTKDGQIAWELQIPGVNNTFYWVHQLERFYEKPLISIHNHTINLNEGTLWLNVSTWDVFKQEATSIGKVKIVADQQEIYQEAFEFLPQWQPNILDISVNNLPSNAKIVEIIIENSDGIKNSVIIYQESEPTTLYGDVPLITVSVMIALSLIVSRRIRKIRKHLEQSQK